MDADGLGVDFVASGLDSRGRWQSNNEGANMVLEKIAIIRATIIRRLIHGDA